MNTEPIKVIHVATLFSPEGLFGGPTNVCLAQAAAFKELGHNVNVLGACKGYVRRDINNLNGIKSHLFSSRNIPGMGFSGIFNFRLYLWLWCHGRNYEVAHIHLGRDLITAPAAIILGLRGVPLIVQTHGMISEDKRIHAKFFDLLLIRPILRRARRILCLSQKEINQISKVMRRPARQARLQLNGIKSPDIDLRSENRNDNSRKKVLFAARLHPRKGAVLFVKMAIDLLEKGNDADFVLMGPDEGDGVMVRRLIEDYGDPRISWIGAKEPAEVHEGMLSASVVVLPSEAEPFGMTIIEAMAVGTPVVIAVDAELAEIVTSNEAGLAVPRNLGNFTSAVEKLLTDAALCDRMGASGKALALQEFGMRQVAENLQADYIDACNRR